MRVLDRYINRELFISCSFAVATLSFVLVFGQIFKKLFEYVVDHNTPVTFILTFVAYFLPVSLALTIPWGFLTAVLLIFGRLSANNELTALRGSGVSTLRIALPVLGFSAALCGVCFWINMYVAPHAQLNLKNAFFKVITSNPAAAFSGDQVITEFPGKKIYIEAKEGDELKNIHVFDLNDQNQPLRVVFAQSGKLVTDLEHKQILLRLSGGKYEQRDPKNPEDLHQIRDGITLGEFAFPISLEELFAKKQGKRGIDSLSSEELKEEFKNTKSLLMNPSTTPRQAIYYTKRLTWMKTEFNRRFSYSLACLTFTLIGIPLGITAHRQETSAGFALSIGVAFTYYLMIIMVNAVHEKPGLHPELLIWLPNVLFLTVGGILFARLCKR